MKRVSVVRRKGLSLLIVLIILVWWVPGALAAPGAGVWYSNGAWFTNCGLATDGALMFVLTAEVPVGYTVVVTWDSESLSGGSHHYRNKWVEATGMDSVSTEYWVVPYDGWIKLTHKVYAPDTKLLTQAYAYANCQTHDVKVYTRDVY